MSARKFTQHDRLLLAGLALEGALAGGDSRHGGALAADAVICADALLTALAETPAPECVDLDALGQMAGLERSMNVAFRHVLGDLADLRGGKK